MWRQFLNHHLNRWMIRIKSTQLSGLSAVKVGRGWSLQVKWEGYPDTTMEPLWKITSQTNHPDVLRDIERCKSDYYLQHPSAKQAAVADFGDISLVDVDSLPAPSMMLNVSKLIGQRRCAMTFLYDCFN